MKRCWKKLLACMAALALCLQGVGIQPIWPANAEPMRGTTAHLTDVPDGYIGIYTKEDLNAIRNDLSGKYLLMNDIVFIEADFAEGGEFYNTGKGWEPIGPNASNAFTGTFDGNGYTIKGMVVNSSGPGDLYASLFGCNSGTIQNIGLLDSNVSALLSSSSKKQFYAYAGGITGFNSAEGTIHNCYSTGLISAFCPYFDTYAYAGGIAGKNVGTISNCYNTGSMEASPGSQTSYSDSYARAGGIAGTNGGTVYNCYNTGRVSATCADFSAAGGIAGINNATINNCYNNGNVCAAISFGTEEDVHYSGITGINNGTIGNCYYLNLLDKNMGEEMEDGVPCTDKEMREQETFSGFDFEAVWEFTEGNPYPYPTLQAVPHTEYRENTTEFAGGKGTIVAPYLISDKTHLNNVRYYLGAHFKMTDNITFDPVDFAEGGTFYNEGHGWQPIGDPFYQIFCGVFDGDGHTITGLVVNEAPNAGLFGGNQGIIRELGISDGSVCGFSTASVSAYTSAGGIVGRNWGMILNCYNTGSVKASAISSSPCSWSGGIAGINSGIISNCYNTGSVEASSSTQHDVRAGGIVGDSYGTVQNCYNTGSVKARSAGGIAGVGGTFSNCYYIDNIEKGIGRGTDTAQKCTFDEMIRQETFDGFDFSTVWTMKGNEDYLYPELQNVPMSYIKKLERLEITIQPHKTLYIEGEVLDTTGMAVTASYNNGTTETVTDYQISGYTSTPGTKTITVTYREKTANFTVTVTAKSLTGITISKKPDKLTYLEGEVFNPSGMVVTAGYDNGTSETVTDYQISGYSSTPGTKTVTVSYQGKTAAFTVTVAPKSLRSISITQKPDKLTYLEGEVLDTTGMVVTASYDNGTTETVTDYQISGYTSTPGTKTIAVTYGGKSASFTVTVTAKSVSFISMKANPSKTSYLTGESLNLAGAKITVKYNNNTQEDIAVTTAMVSGYNANKTGSQTITITYQGKTTSFTVTVNSRVPSSITSSTYNIGGGYLSKISAGITASTLLNGLNEKAYCKVYKGSTEVSGNTPVGTGMTVKLLDGSTVKQTLTIVVTGDTNGDGSITITDMLAVKSHLLKKSTLSGAAAKAADTSGDKAISITDFIQIKAHILGKDKIQPRAC